MLSTGDVTDGRYGVSKVTGKGAFWTVYLAIFGSSYKWELLKQMMVEAFFSIPIIVFAVCIILAVIYINNGWWVNLRHSSIYIVFVVLIFILFHMIFCHRDIRWLSILCLSMFLAGITVLPDFQLAEELGHLTRCKSSDQRVWFARSIKSLYYTDNQCDKCWKSNCYDECRGWVYVNQGGDHKYHGWNHPNMIPLLSPLSLGNLRTCDEASTSISVSEAFTTPDYSIIEIYMGGRWRYYEMNGDKIIGISESSMKHKFWINGAGQVYKDPF